MMNNLPTQDLERLVDEIREALAGTSAIAELEKLRVDYIGKKGALTLQLKRVGTMPPEQRPQFGLAVNDAKKAVAALIDARRQVLSDESISQQLLDERIDVTLPGRGGRGGGLHPLTRTLNRLVDIFQRMGFDVADGPEIEDDFHNFEALNIPPNHPARAMHDTFYIGDKTLLRTHTSPVQVRYMGENPPPIRVIAPGRVYRPQSG